MWFISSLIPLWSEIIFCMISILLNLCFASQNVVHLGDHSISPWEECVFCYCSMEYEISFRLMPKSQVSLPFPPGPGDATLQWWSFGDSWELQQGNLSIKQVTRLQVAFEAPDAGGQGGVGQWLSYRRVGRTNIIKLILCSYTCAWYFTHIMLCNLH